MKKMNQDNGRSLNLVAENLEKLKVLFPEAFTEKGIDKDVLLQLIGEGVDDNEEKYGLNWFGKKRARQIALTPSMGTLRPCKEESVDWDTTKNLFIEGDNLEVLKLLQKSYANKVKMIYIDPPYNTGKEFIYPDKFQDNLDTYLKYTGQKDDEGFKLSSNAESSGRYHTNWLNMMYPRLKLARNLLRNDGVIFISIDDTEMSNLRKLCDEIYGEESFICQIIWKKRSTPPNDKIIGAQHDYILAYCKNISHISLNLRERSRKQVKRYKNPDNHPKGSWAPGDLMANVKGGRYVESLYFPITNPVTGEEHYPSSKGNWRFNKEKIENLIKNDEIYFGANGKGRPKLKRFLAEVKDGITWTSLWDFAPLNTVGSKEMSDIFGNLTVFENPKPTGLLLELVKLGSSSDSVVLDFFAGSATTAHAVMGANVLDNGTRQAIMVQLPETTDENHESFKSGFVTIAEIGKERIRRAAAKIKEENPMFAGDLGFKVFKLDSSNIRAWNPDRHDLEQTLLDHTEHLIEGRSEEDVLYELLLKRGVDLTVPIEEKTITGKTVYSIGYGVLFACLAPAIGRDEVERLVQGIIDWHKELEPVGNTQVVFRDSAFADDIAKTNISAILEQHGIAHVRSL